MLFRSYEIYDSIYIENHNDKDAVIFFANYYYAKGRVKYDKVLREHNQITSPTNLDYADKRNKIGKIYRENFVRGIDWMEKAKNIAPNETIEKNLKFMYEIREKYSTDVTKNSTKP